MKQRRLGQTGLKISEIGLGTMTFAGQCDEAASIRILDTAAEKGVTFIDTADCYPIPPEVATAGASEAVVGRWLKNRSDRDQFVIATKCRIRTGPGPNDQGLSRRHIIKSCETSLKRLHLDTIDLYQAHSPDPETPMEETLRAFDDLVRSGKVRYVGCSNYPAWQVALAIGQSQTLGLARFDSVQPRYNLLHREIETELLPLCRDQGVGVVVYNPLAGGFLSGKYRKEQDPSPNTRFTLGKSGELYRRRYWHHCLFDAVETFKTQLAPFGLSPTAVSIAWVLAQSGITCAIVGASRSDQLDDTLAAVNLTLDSSLLDICDSLWWNLPKLQVAY